MNVTGGAVCADMVWKEHSSITAAFADLDPKPSLGNPGYLCFNGDVAMGYGQAEFIGLGFCVMVFLVFIELFGSVFMKYVCLLVFCSCMERVCEW